MTRDDLDREAWRVVRGLYAGEIAPPAAHAALMDAAVRYADGLAHHAALDTALSAIERRGRQVLADVSAPARKDRT